tara:strand:- start:401 stop:526 length:126 start_codon:yes stop_codon:yes gene_type:complete
LLFISLITYLAVSTGLAVSAVSAVSTGLAVSGKFKKIFFKK